MVYWCGIMFPVRTRSRRPRISACRKEIHEARLIRNAEKREPGIVRRTVNVAAAEASETNHCQPDPAKHEKQSG